jgi:predicted PurR-regulated permease PerM
LQPQQHETAETPVPAGEPAASSIVVSRIEIPKRTYIRVIVVLAIIFLLLQLWTTLLLIFIAFLVATAASPLVGKLEERGVPRGAAVVGLLFALVAVVALLLWLLIPPLVEQTRAFTTDFDNYVQQARDFADGTQAIDDQIENATDGSVAAPSAIFSGFLAVGTSLITGVANFLIVIVLAVYILMDGDRIYIWIARYLPRNQRIKVRQALPEISHVVSGYVIGQSINSTLFGIFTFTVLTMVGVPQAILLALIAAVADAIPIAGVFIATVPAGLVALAAPEGGITTAIIVVVAYTIYQQIENYLIVPRVFGNTLEISSFAILVAVLIGGQLLGIIGVILALPMAAAVPVIERIWGTDLAPGGALASGQPDDVTEHDNDGRRTWNRRRQVPVTAPRREGGKRRRRWARR